MDREPNSQEAAARPSKTSLDRCQYCNITSTLVLRCEGCKVTHYCSKWHYDLDRADHQPRCNDIKICRAKIDGAVVSESVGRHLALAEALFRLGTNDSVSEALQISTRLITPASDDTRALVLGLLLRMDMDLECYDFIKLHSAYGDCWIPGEDPDYALTIIPHRKREADGVLEQPTLCCTGRGDDEHLVGLELLLELKLLVDLISIRSISYALDSANFNKYIFRIHLGMSYDYDDMFRTDADEYSNALRYIDSVNAVWHDIEGIPELLKAAHASAMRGRKRETQRRYGPSGRIDRRTGCDQVIDREEVERLQREDCTVRMWEHLELVVVDAQSISTRRPSRLEYIRRWMEEYDGPKKSETTDGNGGEDGNVDDAAETNAAGKAAVHDDAAGDAGGDDAAEVDVIGDAGGLRRRR
ncbi:hypothetical protein B0A48_05723 [Cryoendolithus antarcticus]|uniref:MYND-type domain-containing protein n=1 Tax=Cryoendolithus antarcticus TaxID=1507870 RepID=A0A1V8TBR8_9PEZI|nr:hypothetical protein B0A48_05723 [Cryoendolithus antarcticus]